MSNNVKIVRRGSEIVVIEKHTREAVKQTETHFRSVKEACDFVNSKDKSNDRH